MCVVFVYLFVLPSFVLSLLPSFFSLSGTLTDEMMYEIELSTNKISLPVSKHDIRQEIEEGIFPWRRRQNDEKRLIKYTITITTIVSDK